jgi:type II secretory pathway component PulM
MTIPRREQSRSWLEQAQSDVRTARAVAAGPTPMNAGDVGCHLAMLCAQALEKGIKGYFVLCVAHPRQLTQVF